MNLLDTTTIAINLWQVSVALIVFLVAAGITYANLRNKIEENTRDIVALKAKDESVDRLSTLVQRIDAKLTVLLPDYNGK